MKHILITGANGQLGNDIRKVAIQFPQFQYFFTDIAELDICNLTTIKTFLQENNISYIVNCAAYTAVDKAEDDIELCYKINRDAIKNLAEAANGKAKIIHVSTDYVFDGKGTCPYEESDATNPQSVYGKSKLDGEDVLLASCPESIVVRTAWLYSIYGNNFVKTMLRLGKEKPELNIIHDQKGTPTYAADLAQAMLSIVVYTEKENKFPAGIYHYSNEGETTWCDFTKKILVLAGINDCKVNPITTDQYPTRAARPMYSVLNKTKIKETFKIVVPQWEQSLQKCLNKFA